MAGGGIQPGIVVGKTDELGYNVIEDPVDVHDFYTQPSSIRWAWTIPSSTYRFQGRDFRLTDVSGNVVKKFADLK